MCLAKEMEFKLSESDYHQKVRGRYNASYVELQLIAWFLFEQGYLLRKHLLQVHYMHLGRKHPFRVLLLVSQPVCRTCERFTGAVNKLISTYYGLKFDLAAGCEDIV
jgi:hypothetical protein